jgi:hypothetical protein
LGRLLTKLENEYVRENTHSREPDNKARSLSISHALKQNALQSNERANEIVSSLTKNVLDSEVGILNKNKSMIDLITKVRTRKNSCFKIEEDDIPHELKIDSQRNFLILHDNGAFDLYRFVVFGHKASLKFMRLANDF